MTADVSAFEPYFREATLVRVHFIVERTGGRRQSRDRRARTGDCRGSPDLGRSFAEALSRHYEPGNSQRIGRWKDAFPAGYRATHPARAAQDVDKLDRLSDDGMSPSIVNRAAATSATAC